MRPLIWPVLFLFLGLLQGTVGILYSGWLSSQLLLVALYAFALLRGSEEGAWAGMAIGLFLDSMSQEIFGYHLLAYTALGYGIGITRHKINEGALVYHLMAVAAVTVALQLTYLLVLLAQGMSLYGLGAFCMETISYCLGNILLVLPIKYLVGLVEAWVRQAEISYKDAKRPKEKLNKHGGKIYSLSKLTRRLKGKGLKKE